MHDLMLAELHAHSTFSRGTKVRVEGLHSVNEMLLHAKKIGLKALAITDHNTIKGGLEARKKAGRHSLIGMAGEEIKTLQGELIGLGLQEEIKAGLSFDETLELIHEQGALAIAPHPFDIYGVGCRKLALKADAVESFNAFNMDKTSNFLAERFCLKHGLIQVSNSDAHCIEMLGTAPTKLLESVETEDDVLQAIRKGKTMPSRRYGKISVLRDWTIKRLRQSRPFVLDYIENNYSGPKKFISKSLLEIAQKDSLASKSLINLFAYSGYCIALGYGLSHALVKL